MIRLNTDVLKKDVIRPNIDEFKKDMTRLDTNLLNKDGSIWFYVNVSEQNILRFCMHSTQDNRTNHTWQIIIFIIII